MGGVSFIESFMPNGVPLWPENSPLWRCSHLPPKLQNLTISNITANDLILKHLPSSLIELSLLCNPQAPHVQQNLRTGKLCPLPVAISARQMIAVLRGNTLSSLSSLRIAVSGDLDDSFFMAVVERCPSLEQLEIHRSRPQWREEMTESLVSRKYTVQAPVLILLRSRLASFGSSAA